MKLHILKGGNEFSLEIREDAITEGPLKFITELYDKIFAEPMPIQMDTHLIGGELDLLTEHQKTKPTGPIHVRKRERENFSFRERLPNNVIDINKLSVKEAVTENTLVRCPKCGQSHAIVLKDGSHLYLMRRCYSIAEFSIVKEINDTPEDVISICCMDKTPKGKLDYFFKLQEYPLMENKDFAVNNETEVFCPVCGESSPFIEWKEAHEDSMMYFEYEYICGACGGECLMDAQNEKDGKEIVVCKECGRKWLKGQLE